MKNTSVNEEKNSGVPSSRSKATPELDAVPRFFAASKLKRNKGGHVIGALNEYECGCAITRDSAGGTFLHACALHNAAPALYKAAQKVLDGLNARIKAASDAGGQSIPVFDGIADLRDALALAGKPDTGAESRG